MKRTALVTGATGCIGTALIKHLLHSGEYGEVRALVRPESAAAAPQPAGVTICIGTLEDADALRRAARGAQDVFHTAARVHDPDGDPAEFERVNVLGTQCLLDCCDRDARFVFFSTVAVYGESTPPEGIAEEAPPAPVTPYAQSKVRAEAAVHAWGKANGAVAINLRVATVYGPRDRGNMARMMEAVARGRFLLIGSGNNAKTCVAVDNVAMAALALARADAERVRDRAIVVADPCPYSLRDLARAMRAALGLPAKETVRAVPFPLALFLAGCAEAAARRIGRKAPLTRVQVRRLAAWNVYRAGALREIAPNLSFIGLSEGLARAAAWYNAGRIS